MEDGLDAVGSPSFDDRICDDAPEQGVDRRRGATRRELDAPTGRCRGHWNDQLRCGVADRVGIGVGDARMQGDLDGVVVVAGDGPCRRLQQRIDEEGGESIALLVDEFALDEGDVAHDDRTG